MGSCAWAVMVFLLAVLAVLERTGAASPAPAPAPDCSSAVLSLSDCLSYVQEGSNVTKPGGTCCSSLKKVVKTEAACLCEGFKNSAALGLSLNMTKALALPAICKVSTKPLSGCKTVTGAAPAPSPFHSSTNAPLGAPTAAGVPTSSPPMKASAGALQLPFAALLVGLVAAVALPCF